MLFSYLSVPTRSQPPPEAKVAAAAKGAREAVVILPHAEERLRFQRAKASAIPEVVLPGSVVYGAVRSL